MFHMDISGRCSFFSGQAFSLEHPQARYKYKLSTRANTKVTSSHKGGLRSLGPIRATGRASEGQSLWHVLPLASSCTTTDGNLPSEVRHGLDSNNNYISNFKLNCVYFFPLLISKKPTPKQTPIGIFGCLNSYQRTAVFFSTLIFQ